MAKSWIGETIGDRYKIDSLLGQGGMSAVYRATDPNLRRMVAIKLIHPHLSVNPNFVHRFKEEAAAVARLRHPHIVQVHDFNVDGETYYMVMEYLTGESLQAHLNRLNKTHHLMSYPKAIQICMQICEALGYAHKHELVHRDIKPANIMLDIHGQAILMDFGIVKIIGGEYHTATGATLGTVKYMSPEQMRSEKVDERSDIFSLGVTLYEMVTGRVPYMADSVPTLMMMALNEPLPDLRDIRRGIPEELAQVVERALAKDKAERFQTMEEMAAALDQALQVVENIQPAETVLDEGDPDQAPINKKRLHGSGKPRPSSPVDGLSAGTPEGGPQDRQQNSELADRPTVLETQRETPMIDRVGLLSELKQRIRQHMRVIILVSAAVLVGVVGTVLYVQFQGAPSIELAAIKLPAEEINALTAPSIVSLGVWNTDSTITDLVFSPDGELLGTANNRDSMRFSSFRYYGALWDVDSGTLQNALPGHSQWVYSAAFSLDGRLFGTASDDDRITLWNVDDGSQDRQLETSIGGITAIDFSSNNKILAAGSWEGTVSLWQLDGHMLRTLEGHETSVRDVEFSPDGSLIASASDDHTVMIWRVTDGGLLHTLRGHSASVRSIAFSQDGNWLASASEDRTIGIWRVGDGSRTMLLQGNSDTVTRVVFSPDHSLLASGADDGKIMLWQMEDGALIRVLEEYSETITGLDFSPQGNLLAAGAWDGTIMFWGLSEAIPFNNESSTPDS